MSRKTISKAVLLNTARKVSYEELLYRSNGCYFDLDTIVSNHTSGDIALEILEDYLINVGIILKQKYPNLAMTIHGCDWDSYMHINDCPGNYYYHLFGEKLSEDEFYDRTPSGAYRHTGYVNFPDLGYKGHIWMERDFYTYRDYEFDCNHDQHEVLIEIFRSLEDKLKKHHEIQHFIPVVLYAFLSSIASHMIICDHFVAIDVQRLLSPLGNEKHMDDFTSDYNYAIWELAETAGHLELLDHSFEYDLIWD